MDSRKEESDLAGVDAGADGTAKTICRQSKQIGTTDDSRACGEELYSDRISQSLFQVSQHVHCFGRVLTNGGTVTMWPYCSDPRILQA